MTIQSHVYVGNNSEAADDAESCLMMKCDFYIKAA